MQNIETANLITSTLFPIWIFRLSLRLAPISRAQVLRALIQPNTAGRLIPIAEANKNLRITTMNHFKPMSKPERIFTGNVNIDTTKAISVNDFNLLKAKGVIKVEKKSKRHLESELQQACVTWFRLQHPTNFCFAIPNGGQRSKVRSKNHDG